MFAIKRNIIRLLTIVLWVLLVPILTYVASLDLKIGVAMVVGIIGMAICLVCVINYKLGYYIFITITLILPLLERISGSSQSVGVVMDGLLISTLLGCILRRGDKSVKKVQFMKDALLISFYLYTLLLIIQIANPSGHRILAWFIFFRVFARNMIFLGIGLHVFNNMKDVRTFFKFWIAICTAAAIYACLQQWFGLMPYEKAFIAKYPKMFNTTIIISGIRIFSFMSDAASFGIIMACNIIICLILLTAKLSSLSLKKKLLLIVSIILQALALGYSGTRTGYVMLPVGLLLFLLTTLRNRNTILIAIAFGFTGLVILFGPFHSNGTVIRIRTAFLGKQDASMDVRDENRHRIQPYIYDHPLGGGVMTTGGNGQLFYPGHPVANLQTDNGYLRAVLETGWLGVLLVAANFFLLICIAIRNYFRIEGEVNKLLMLGIAASMLEMALAQYAQDASTLVESSIMLNALTAIAIKVKYLYALNTQS